LQAVALVHQALQHQQVVADVRADYSCERLERELRGILEADQDDHGLDDPQIALAVDEAQRTSREESDLLRARFALLTAREREVFDRIVAGRLNKQIADELGIGERTVKAQRAQVLAKLGVESVAELGRLAERLQSLTRG